MVILTTAGDVWGFICTSWDGYTRGKRGTRLNLIWIWFERRYMCGIFCIFWWGQG